MRKQVNPWSKDDEREHYPSVLEWWCTEGFITDENKDTWSFKGSFSEWCTAEKKHGSTYDFTLFDLKSKTHVSQYSRSDTEKLEIKYNSEKQITTSFDTSFLSGSYPSYQMHFENQQKDIILDVEFKSIAFPHWITQDITGGYLPMGLGFYRYGFIPKNTIQGTLKIGEKNVSVQGMGYYEHVFGDFSYRNPLSNLSYLKKSIRIYQKLIAWWMYHHRPKIPNKLTFFSENNFLGYDWVWGVLDNGWSFFLGNILFWVAEGPIFGTLIFTKDGKSYQEFCDVSFKYSKMASSNHYDFVYPTGLEIRARNQKEGLNLSCQMVMEPREFVTPLNQRRWQAFVICEAPGTVTGSYWSEEKMVTLSGMCKIEPQRQVSIHGHNELTVRFVKPPKGVGMDVFVDSHLLRKQMRCSLVFSPFPKITGYLKKDDSIDACDD